MSYRNLHTDAVMTTTLRYIDETTSHDGYEADDMGTWVVETDGEWIATVTTDGHLDSVRDALGSLGYDTETLRPTGANVCGPIAPAATSTWSPEWTL